MSVNNRKAFQEALLRKSQTTSTKKVSVKQNITSPNATPNASSSVVQPSASSVINNPGNLSDKARFFQLKNSGLSHQDALYQLQNEIVSGQQVKANRSNSSLSSVSTAVAIRNDPTARETYNSQRALALSAGFDEVSAKQAGKARVAQAMGLNLSKQQSDLLNTSGVNGAIQQVDYNGVGTAVFDPTTNTLLLQDKPGNDGQIIFHTKVQPGEDPTAVLSSLVQGTKSGQLTPENISQARASTGTGAGFATFAGSGNVITDTIGKVTDAIGGAGSATSGAVQGATSGDIQKQITDAINGFLGGNIAGGSASDVSAGGAGGAGVPVIDQVGAGIKKAFNLDFDQTTIGIIAIIVVIIMVFVTFGLGSRRK